MIQRLVDFGMTERESKIYIALLEKPEATAAELHRISGVMRTKTYETLSKMVARGFCQERVTGRRRYYRAIRPAVLRDVFQRRWDLEHEQRHDSANEAFGELDILFRQQPKESRSLDLISVIRSFDQIRQTFLTHNVEAEKEVLSFNRSPWGKFSAELFKEQESVQQKAISRGVEFKTIYMVEEGGWSWVRPSILNARDNGEESRVNPEIPMKMYVFDRRKVMLALSSVPGNTMADFTMVLIEDPGFTKACVSLFNNYWEQSYTLEQWESQLSIDERLLLRQDN